MSEETFEVAAEATSAESSDPTAVDGSQATIHSEAAAQPFGSDVGQDVSDVSNEATPVDIGFVEPVASVAPQSPPSDPLADEPIVAEDATTAEPAASVAVKNAEGESQGLTVQVLLRRAMQVGEVQMEAGTLLGTVSLQPGVSLNYLVDSFRNGFAKAV